MAKLKILTPGNKYAIGAKSTATQKRVVNDFHDEVIRQILLGNRVLLPYNISIDIVKIEHRVFFGRIQDQSRPGFNYKVRFSFNKLKEKSVNFTTARSLDKKLNLILRETNFEYKLVEKNYK